MFNLLLNLFLASPTHLLLILSDLVQAPSSSGPSQFGLGISLGFAQGSAALYHTDPIE